MRATFRLTNLSYSLSACSQRADLTGVLFQLAEYGDVEAPIGAIIGGAVVVTGLALASTFAFKSGFEESARRCVPRQVTSIETGQPRGAVESKSDTCMSPFHASQEKIKERDAEYFGKKLPKGGINNKKR